MVSLGTPLSKSALLVSDGFDVVLEEEFEEALEVVFATVLDEVVLFETVDLLTELDLPTELSVPELNDGLFSESELVSELTLESELVLPLVFEMFSPFKSDSPFAVLFSSVIDAALSTPLSEPPAQLQEAENTVNMSVRVKRHKIFLISI